MLNILPFKLLIGLYILTTALSIGSVVDDTNNDVDPDPTTTKSVKVNPTEVSAQIRSNATNKAKAKINNITRSNSRDVNTIISHNGTYRERITRRIVNIFYTVMLNAKVKNVVTDVGTCMTNGLMDLITHFVPSPLVPLVANAISLVIPFKPVVMFRDRLPVSSYARAFGSALSSFLSTFDEYKMEDEEPDPYNTRKFNRRMMTEKRN